MQLPEMISINKQIYDSILDYKKSIIKNTSKEQTKPFLSLFNKEWFLENFPDVFSFFSSIDTRHPDLMDFLNNIFDSNFLEKSKSIDSIIKFCTTKKINNINISSVLASVLLENINSKIINNLGNPEVTLNHIRFLSPCKRWLARGYKNVQVVSPKERYFNQLIQEEELEYFGHNSMKIESYHDLLLSKYNDLKKINCNFMAKELAILIDKVKDNLNQKKYGFYRVPISKIINIVSAKKQIDIVEIIPIKTPDYLKNRNCPNFIRLCESFFDKNHGVFDHYAEIKFGGWNTSYLIGEIDSKSYFIGAI